MLVIPYPAIDPVALSLGPVEIKWYGIAYAAGLLLGWTYIRRLLSTPRLWRGEKPPIDRAAADDLFIFVALGVVIGGRLGNVLLYDLAYYTRHPLEIFAIWRGGMAFHGGLAGTIVAMWLFARRNGANPLSIMDLVAAAVPFGLFFGRVANFINAEVLGRITNVPWAMVFPGAGPLPRHPAQLYEAVLEGIVLFLVLRFATHARGTLRTPGLTGAIFLIGYGVVRIACELFKEDDYAARLGIQPLTLGMIYSLPMIAAGVIAILLVTRGSKTAA
jgi:phosphatidylglycerol:prolipoprotein diacylglycerol transferase